MPPRNINYLEIIHNAWRITWKHKFLWWFGFFAAAMNVGNSFFYLLAGEKEENKNLDSTVDFVTKHPGWLMAAVIGVLILYLAFFFIQALAQGSLIKSIGRISRKEPSSFKSALRDGKTYLWKIFLIRILIGLSMLCIGAILFTPIVILLYLKADPIAVILVFLALIILIPLSFLALFMEIYSLMYAVIGDLPIWLSLENAYLVLRKNLTPSIIMGLIVIMVNSLTGIFMVMLLLPLLIAVILIGLLITLAFQKTGIALTVITGFTAAFVLLIFLRSVYGVFTQSLWILFFEEIGSPKSDKEPGEPVEEKFKIKTAPKTDPVEGV